MSSGYKRKTIPVTTCEARCKSLRDEAEASKQTALSALKQNDRLLTLIEQTQFRFNALFVTVITFAIGWFLWTAFYGN